MYARDSLSFINTLEERFPVDRWIVNDLPVWPLIRINLYFILRNKALGQVSAKPKGFSFKAIRYADRLARDIGYYAHAMLADREHNARPAPAVAVFYSDSYSRVLIDGSWYDRLCEPVIDHLESSGIGCFQMDRYHEYRIPRHNRSLYVQFALDRVFILSGVLARFRKLPALDLEGYDNCRREVVETTSVPLLAPRSLALQTLFLRRAADYFKKILRAIKPVIAFVVEYYSPTGMAFMLACSELGILSVDIPHGNHGDIHVAYSRWNRIPASRYPMMPKVFLCWTKNEVESINQWAQRTGGLHRAIEGGNPWMDIWKSDNAPFTRQYDDTFASLRKPGTTLQVLINYEHRVSDMISMLRKAPYDWCWWVRMHPTKLQERENVRNLLVEAGITNFEIDAATDLPLYALLRNVDVHVTECSSVVIEAEEFRVPSVITRTYGTEAFSHQLTSGWAVPAYNDDEIITAIRRIRDQERNRSGDRQPTQASWTDVVDKLVAEAETGASGTEVHL